MSNIVDMAAERKRRQVKRDEHDPDFAETQRRNKENEERMQRERRRQNESVKRTYRIDR